MHLHRRQQARSEVAVTAPLVPGLAWATAGVEEAMGADGIRARGPAVAQVLVLVPVLAKAQVRPQVPM